MRCRLPACPSRKEVNFLVKKSIVELVIDKVASPLILGLLKPFSAKQLQQAIRSNFSIVGNLKKPENKGVLSDIRLGLAPFPPGWVAKAMTYIYKRKWLMFFITNHLTHKRKDLYDILTLDPKGFKWLQTQLKEVADFLG